MRGFASKQSSMIKILYTQREILLFSDGSFAYKRKNKSEKTKQLINQIDILSVQQSKQYLTLSTNYDSSSENIFVFKFNSC